MAWASSPLAVETWAGQPANGSTAYTLTCDAGAYVIAGQDSTLTYTPAVGPTAYTLDCDAGAYAIQGQSAVLSWIGARVGGGWAEFVEAEKRRRKQPDPEEAMAKALEPVVSAPRKTITMASLVGKRAAAEIEQRALADALSSSRKRKRQREDEFLLLM